MVGVFRYSPINVTFPGYAFLDIDHSEGVPLTFAAYQDAFITVASTVTPAGTQFFWETRDKLSNGSPGYLTEPGSSTILDAATHGVMFSFWLSDHHAYFEGGGFGDWLEGGKVSDTLLGRAGDDTLYGFEGDDLLDGGDGTDSIAGGAGNDTLMGGADFDRLFGEAGSDSLWRRRRRPHGWRRGCGFPFWRRRQ